MSANEKLSLSELRETRAEMTPGPWNYDVYNAVLQANENGSRIGEFYGNSAGANGDGVAATHNAADLLIEISEAAMEHIRANEFGTGEESWEAEKRLVAALSKVRK